MATAKKEEKKVAAKPAPKKEEKKAAPAKPAPKKEEKKAAPAKAAPTKADPSHVYHVSKRKEDSQWKVFNAGSDKVIKLFKTQAEALDYAKTLAKKQDGSVMLHGLDGKLRKF